MYAHTENKSHTKRTDQTKHFFNIPILVILRSDQWQILIIKAHFMAGEVELQRCKGELDKVKRWQRAQSPPPCFLGPALPARLEFQPEEHCVQPCSRCPLQSLVLMEKQQASFHVTFCTLTGAFLIPYVVFFICCGIPVFFLETALGQFTSEGGITCWRKVCPLFEGKC